MKTAGSVPVITIALVGAACAFGATLPVATPSLSTLTTVVWLLGAGAAVCLLLRRAIDADDRARELATRLAREQDARRAAETNLADTQTVLSKLVVEKGNEIKVVIPQANQDLAAYEHLDFDNFFVQPMDGLLAAQNTRLAIETCRRNPKWKLSLQTHKLLQIP
jgi:hypothetical protein